MNLKAVLKPIAVSLAAQEWAQPALSLHLKQRLPPELHRSVAPLSKSLIRAFPKGAAPDARRIEAFLRTQPAAQRILAFAIRTGQLPAPSLAPVQFRPDPALAHLDLPALATPAALADWLGLPPEQLVRFADLRQLSASSPNWFAQHYTHHLIPKRNGQLRLIEEPRPLLKHLQRRVLHGVLDKVPPHDSAFGFTAGRNCIQAAARHAAEAVVVSFDLADFFARIGFARIYALYRTLGYPPAVARDLAGICTAVTPPALLRRPDLAGALPLSQRHLPQGAPTSPALANLCAHTLDTRLAGLASTLGGQYTRYADDLAFSGDARIAPILMRAVPQIVADAGFVLNPAKTRTARAHQRQTVTGITVNAHVNIPRAHYDRLKATVHHLGNPTDPRRRDPQFLARLSGQIAWVEQLAPRKGHRLREKFEAGLATPT